MKEQHGSTYCGKRPPEAGAVRVFETSRSRRAGPLRSSFLEMTPRREALRCRARLNLLTPPGLYHAQHVRGNKVNFLDLSLNKGFRLPFEGHKLDVRFEFFNILNHPNFTWAGGSGADNSNGDVTNPFFNNVRLNDGGLLGPVGTQVGRYGRMQVRYSF
ncbi:MAG: hypothetical protein AABO41_08345 [Acidobacteriota bacterium]